MLKHFSDKWSKYTNQIGMQNDQIKRGIRQIDIDTWIFFCSCKNLSNIFVLGLTLNKNQDICKKKELIQRGQNDTVIFHNIFFYILYKNK